MSNLFLFSVLAAVSCNKSEEDCKKKNSCEDDLEPETGSPGNTNSNDSDDDDSPDSNGTWGLVSDTDAPGKRFGHSAVWTGEEVIVWGGHPGGSGSAANDGAAFYPSSDSWSQITSNGAPDGRYYPSAVWTGSVMLVWGGVGDSSKLNTGGLYDPNTNSWADINTTSAPTGRSDPAFAYDSTNNKFYVWGGVTSGSASSATNTGGVYDIDTDSWTSLPTTGALSERYECKGIWTGTGFLVWGGKAKSTGAPLNDGAIYTPGSGWSDISSTNAPGGRNGFVMVWTGEKVVIWGGYQDNGNYLSDGGIYDPDTDKWTAISEEDAPTKRYIPAYSWTGTSIIIWGGRNNSDDYLDSGAQYFPDTDTWIPIEDAPLSGRSLLSSVWTGSKFFVWGGDEPGKVLSDGAVYEPTTP